ncbi:unnamed protein product [Paramecium pentaurelia]|uniref:EamA domain-containing protein n=1 Tax=Paramecium pentaurelia TaxID=43138 RepID=A0A8S1WYY9_9CILI|nr:unnamed protein product [Paramecium pentaurelia]
MFISKISRYLKEMEDKNTLRAAIIYMLVAYFFHAVQITFFKYGHFDIVPQSLFIRSISSLILIFLFQQQQNYYPKGKTQYLIKSQLLGAIGSSIYFFGLSFISLSEAAILFSTNSIWSQLIVSCMKREHITKSRLINSIICIVGIGLVSNPTLSTEDPFMHIIGCFSILLCSIVQSFSYITMKQIGSEVSATIVTSYFHIMIIISSSLWQQYIGRFEYFTGYWFYILGFAVFTLFGQMLQFRAQTMVTYDKICNYTYSQTLYVIIIDYVLFRKILSLNGFIGGCLILFGVFKQLSEDKKLRG